jgi:hypothetical protein
MIEDLRRIPRISVCCHVVVRDRYGIWTAVTDDLCARGCQIVTQRQLRPGSTLHLTIASDLFVEELDVLAQAAWTTPHRLGVLFVGPGDRTALSPQAFVDLVLEHGEMADSATTWRLVPSVQRLEQRTPITTTARNGRLVRTATAPESRERPPVRRAE